MLFSTTKFEMIKKNSFQNFASLAPQHPEYKYSCIFLNAAGWFSEILSNYAILQDSNILFKPMLTLHSTASISVDMLLIF